MTHLDPSSVLEAAEGNPSTRASRHLARCRECRRRVEEVLRILQDLEATPSAPEGPSPMLDRWALAVARNARTRTFRRRHLALLGGATSTAIRGSSATAWLVGDERTQIDLRAVQTASGRFTLRGHVVRRDGVAVGWRVRVEGAGRMATATFTDPWGEFVLEELSAGSLALVLEGDGNRLEAPTLELA